MKKLLLILIFTSLSSFFHAKTISFQDENYTGNIRYNEEAFPGDAVFTRMSLKFTKPLKKKMIPNFKAVLQLYDGDKKINNSQFFMIPQKTRKTTNYEMIGCVPLSTFLNEKDSYLLKVIFTTGIFEAKEFSLPLKLMHKDFVQETIKFDEKKSEIKQKVSREKITQADKIYKIFETVNSSHFYSSRQFIKPVDSETKTAFFGDRRIYKYQNEKKDTTIHNGIDYGIPEGTEVKACQTGKVVLAEFRITTGFSIVIEHLPGLYSVYYHLNELSTKEGQNVKAGDIIGKSGSTGLATGPHLHWEIRLNNSTVNPEFFLSDYSFESEM